MWVWLAIDEGKNVPRICCPVYHSCLSLRYWEADFLLCFFELVPSRGCFLGISVSSFYYSIQIKKLLGEVSFPNSKFFVHLVQILIQLKNFSRSYKPDDEPKKDEVVQAEASIPNKPSFFDQAGDVSELISTDIRGMDPSIWGRFLLWQELYISATLFS